MSENGQLRTSQDDAGSADAQDDGDAGSLASRRAETDRLFAAAEKSFAAIAQHDSMDFLRRSRQTGGQ